MLTNGFEERDFLYADDCCCGLEIIMKKYGILKNKNIIDSLINTKINSYFFKLYTNWNNLKEYDLTIYGDINIKIDIILWTFLNKVKLESINKMDIFNKTKYEMKILNEYIKYSNNNELLIYWDKIKELKINEYEKQILEDLRPEMDDKN
jgi:hypothetical protein